MTPPESAVESDRRRLEVWLSRSGEFNPSMSMLDARPPIRDAAFSTSGFEGLAELGLESGVCLQSRHRIVVAANEPFLRWFGQGKCLLGHRSNEFMVGAWSLFDELSDQLLHESTELVSVRHQAPYDGGQCFYWSTCKFAWSFVAGASCPINGWPRPTARTESANGSAGCEGLLVMLTRPIGPCHAPCRPDQLSLNRLAALYEQLDSTDRLICVAMSRGDSIADVAATAGLTRRSIENRRTRILEHFEFQRPVDIIRLIVRLEENGLIR